jgi:hypothetical protein
VKFFDAVRRVTDAGLPDTSCNIQRTIADPEASAAAHRANANGADPEASAEARKAEYAALDGDESKSEQAPVTTSWRVEVTDDSGKVWASGVRLATKDEAMRYMWHAVGDFVKEDMPPIVAMRTVQSSDAWNMQFNRYKSGPHKGRFNLNLIFQHGTCELFGWNSAEPVP